MNNSKPTFVPYCILNEGERKVNLKRCVIKFNGGKFPIDL